MVFSGNVVVDPGASSLALYLQEMHQWNSSIEEPLHSPTVEKSERQAQDQDLRCQSWPAAKKFSHLQWRRHFQEIWRRPTTPADFGSSFRTTSLHQTTFACWNIRFKTEVCTSSQIPFGSYAMDQRSGDGWFSGWFSWSIRGIQLPNFEVLDV